MTLAGVLTHLALWVAIWFGVAILLCLLWAAWRYRPTLRRRRRP